MTVGLIEAMINPRMEKPQIFSFALEMCADGDLNSGKVRSIEFINGN